MNILFLLSETLLFVSGLIFLAFGLSILRNFSNLAYQWLLVIGVVFIQALEILYAVSTHSQWYLPGYMLAAVIVSVVSVKYYCFFDAGTISLDDVVAQLPGHVYWKNLSGACIGCNDLHWRNFGSQSLNQFIGKTGYDLFSKAQADIIKSHDDEVIKTGNTKLAKESSKTIYGEETVFLSCKVPLRNKNNQIIGISGISIDITELKL